MGFYLLQYIDAVDLGHADVEQQYIGMVLLPVRARPAAKKVVQDRLAVLEMMDGIAQTGVSKGLLDKDGVTLVIFSDEHYRSVLHASIKLYLGQAGKDT